MITTRDAPRGYAQFQKRPTATTVSSPPAFLEYTWYVSLAYAMLGSAWGIVIPSVGGAILMLLAASCWLSVGVQGLRVYKPVVLALSTGVLVIAIQMIFHKGNERALSEGIVFVGWLAQLIIVQSLSLRPRFLQRFALAAFGIGLAVLPYLNFRAVGGVMRVWASGTSMSNPNSLGMWFGFCAVYFIFLSFQLRNPISRVASWSAVVACLYVISITVSRAPVLGILLACVVGFRSVLKRSFVPLLSLVLLMCLVYLSGVFDDTIGYFFIRGAEESGREKLWPLALERILDSPWIGVGMGDVLVQLRSNRFMVPHNGLLHIALAAGIVPLICFLGYLARAVIGALRMMQKVHVGEAALLPPLVVYALFETMVLDFAFISPWTSVILGLAAAAGMSASYQKSISA